MYRIVSLLLLLTSAVLCGKNCDLSSSMLSCSSTDNVSVYPGQDPAASYGKGLHADVSLITNNKCNFSVKDVHYKLSIATHFDYSSVPLDVKPAGCNSAYNFKINNSTSFFLSSFMPNNVEPQEIDSTISFDSIEEDCVIQVSMNMLWIDNVPKTCSVVV